MAARACAETHASRPGASQECTHLKKSRLASQILTSTAWLPGIVLRGCESVPAGRSALEQLKHLQHTSVFFHTPPLIRILMLSLHNDCAWPEAVLYPGMSVPRPGTRPSFWQQLLPLALAAV